MRSLDLYGTKIGDGGLASLRGLTKLQKLNLGMTAISDGGLVQLKPFVDLTELSLDNTKITGAGLVHIKPLTKLRRLDLSVTRVDDAGLAFLQGLTDLRTLRLDAVTTTDGRGFRHISAAGQAGKTQASLKLRASDARPQGISKKYSAAQANWTFPPPRSATRPWRTSRSLPT